MSTRNERPGQVLPRWYVVALTIMVTLTLIIAACTGTLGRAPSPGTSTPSPSVTSSPSG